MSGGGGSEEVKITPEEVEQIKVAEEQWARYEEVGVPLSNAYIERATGYRVGENGELNIVDGGILNADGSVKTDASSAIASTNKAYAKGLQHFNPNEGRSRTGVVDIEAKKMQTASEAEAGVKLGQQNRWLKGLENVVAMGKGQETTAVNGLMDLSANAASEARQDAYNAFADGQSRKQLAGQVIGAGASLAMGYNHRGGQGLASLAKNTANGGLFGARRNGLKNAQGGRYYDAGNDYHA